MKLNPTILFLLLSLAAGTQAKEPLPASDHSDAAEQSDSPAPAGALAAQVQEIAATTNLSRKSQAKLIAAAVRRAIATATEGIKDPAERLQLAVELTAAATKAAPQFAATITQAVSSLPAIAKIEGASDAIKEAVKQGQEAADEPGLANPSRNPPQHGHEFEGPNKGEHIVSPSH